MAAFEAANPGAAELLATEHRSLTELHDRSRPPQHWADIEAGHVDDDLREFSDQFDLAPYEDEHQDEDGGIFGGPRPGYDPDDAWRGRVEFANAIDAIRARYAVLLRPYEDSLRRNIGVKPVAMARLEAARDAEIRDLTRSRQRALAYERAAREAPQRAMTAHERELEQAALNAFGRDVARGRRYQPPQWAGRDTSDIAVW